MYSRVKNMMKEGCVIQTNTIYMYMYMYTCRLQNTEYLPFLYLQRYHSYRDFNNAN